MFPYIELAAANGWMGRPAEASAAVAELQKLKPSFTVQDYLALPHPVNAKWKSEDLRIVQGLRKAGLPEGPPRYIYKSRPGLNDISVLSKPC